MHACWIDAHQIEQGGPSAGLVSLGISGGQIALVALLDVDLGSVDRVTCWVTRDSAQHGGADATAREAHAGVTGCRLPFDQRRDQASGDGFGEVGRVGMTNHVDGAHGDATRAMTSP